MSTTTYPVHVDAELQPGLSRWLWLVKWIMVLPHYVVLAFLWLTFFVLSVVSFFAILFTGRYPRSIFEFNVGVLRWSWRVAYYAYGALGTDRYPPFTLRDVPDYPAHLEIDYPEHLSRGLVLVKWWLLAIPHYIVVGLLLGGAGYAVRGENANPDVWGTGLIGLLVLVAGVLLLFTGRYPQQLFDLVLGLNRWVLRVAGYAALMTDKYPPFSLEQGGHEGGHGPGTSVMIHPPMAPAPQSAPPSAPPPGSPHGSGWTSGRIVSLVAGAVLALVAIGSGITGVGLVAADLGARDDSGFLMSSTQVLSSSTYAITSSNIDLHGDAPSAFMPESLIGDAKITATAANGKDVFVAIGPTDQVRSYLSGVEHATLVDWTNGDPVLRTTGGTAPTAAPAAQDFWVAQSSGSGTQTITWPVESGEWSAVVMNSDPTPGVAVDVTAGAEVPALSWVIAFLLTVAAVTLVLAVVLIAVPVRAVSRSGGSS